MKRPDITPGPWEIGNAEDGPAIFGQSSIPPIECVVAKGSGWSMGTNAPTQKHQNNLCAIAALPELLDALEAAAIHSHAMTLDGYTIAKRKDLARSTNEKIKAALVKAGYAFQA